jgi:L-threonylcarbamoyladenylate synthase
MSRFAYVKPHSPSGMIALSDVAEIADSLRRGCLAILPTETGYMLAALATSEDAVKKAFTAKGRAAAAVMHVACASLAMAQSAGVLTDAAATLLGRFTPGPLSVIVNKTDLLPDDLVTLNGTVGIRIPDHPGTLQVVNAVGLPLTATSLNSSGSTLSSVDEESLETMNWPRDETIHVLLDNAAVTYSSASTLVRLTGPGVEILRAGPISEEQIRQALAG